MNKSRRSFLQSTTLGTLGVFSSINSTSAQTFFESLIEFDSKQNPLLVQVLRHSDLLNLKLHLYNIKYDKHHFLTPIPKKDFFMFIQLPSQHIAEELVTQLHNDSLKKRKKSFLAGSSWLVLKHHDQKKLPRRIDESYLLDWENNFELVTLDHLTNSKGKFSELNLREKRELICDIKKFTSGSHDKPLVFNNEGNIADTQFYSSFEVPYKMFLSPISEAIEGYKFERQIGRHTFSSNKNINLLNIQDGSNFYSLHKVWENELYFQAINGNNYPPRFKVVDYDIPSQENDNDLENENGSTIEFLPKPIHRRELSELTMLPYNKRDVVSDFFKISALGVSTKFKYENEQPIENTSIVSWKQHIKYARDNYVSVTFRAIDVFTGLKLLVSIVAERKFQEGKSFLLQRYFISYLESEKEFEEPQVIGKMTFTKIIAITKGAFFSPISVDDNGNAYHVQLEDLSKQCESLAYEFQNDLEFKYLGIDKKGIEHSFSSKIIFIPAECYKIKTGEYTYNCNEFNAVKYNSESNVCIDIRYIGALNPNCQIASDEGDDNCFVKKECKEKYTYAIERNFDDKALIASYLNAIATKINGNPALRHHYSIQINNKITFADISTLQIDIHGAYLVNPKSDNATFKTRNIFLFTTVPEKESRIEKEPEDYNELDCCEKDVTYDPFSVKYPLIPFLHHAEVVIPQISQIEGRDVFRGVALADSFWFHEKINGIADFEPNSPNNYQLLFKLIDNSNINIKAIPKHIPEFPLKGFFSDNYKNSGGAANPGITIKNISVLDNGIIYSEFHNKSSQNGNLKTTDVSVETSLSTNSIFEALEAEICGINLLKIVETSLGIDDLPVFNYIKDADEAFAKAKKQFESIKSVYEEWEGEYNRIETEINNLKQDIQDLGLEFIDDSVKELRGQINTLIEQSNLLSKLKTASTQIESEIPDKNVVKKKYEALEQEVSKYIEQRTTEDHLKSFNEVLDKLNLTDYYPKYLKKEDLEELDTKFKFLAEKTKNIVKNLKATDKVVNDFINYIFFRFLYSILSKAENKDFDIKKYEQKLYLEVYIEKFKILKKDIELEASQLSTDLQKQYNENYQAFIKGIDMASKYCNVLNEINTKRLEEEICRKTKKIISHYSEKISESIDTTANEIEIEKYLERIRVVKTYFKKYEFYRSIYKDFNDDFKLFSNAQLDSNKLKELLLDDLDDAIKSFKDQNTKDELHKIFNLIHDRKSDIFNQYNEFLEDYNNLVDNVFNNINTGALALYKYEQKFNETLEKAKIKAKHLKQKIKAKESEITGFFDKKKKELDVEFQRQLEILKNDPRNIEAQKFIKEIKAFKQKLQEASNQKLNYIFNTKKFRSADLGVISFAANENTELSVKVDYSIQFDISEFDKPPVLSKQSFSTDTTFSDFQVSFLKLISLDFEKVRFISGSDVKDDFQVKIRDVQFAGCLSFVDAIQEYLNGLSNNLIFEVTSQGAMVNYILPPFEINAPPFKFFNISFSALLFLPFDPKKSLQLKFGLGSEINKFGLIYLAFGGQGYFNIIVEPKEGIVGLEVVLEFGAIYYVNIGGIAKGVAYLVGGIYIKRYYGNFQIKAYILCVGRFSILNLFSASASFYLGLEGDGNRLDGVCIITFSKRFSRFFKIKVKVSMRKTIYGAKKSNENDLKISLSKLGYTLLDTNISELMCDDEKQFITLSFKKQAKLDLPTISGNGLNFKSISRPESSKKSNIQIIEYEIESSVEYIESLTINNVAISLKSLYEKDESEKSKIIRLKDKKRRDKEYYKSIFI